MTEEQYLAHHGIKGMRWGIRRTPEELGHYRKKKTNIVKQKIEEAKQRKAEKKLRSEEEKHEDLKRYLRKHPTKLYKHGDEFTKEELDEIISKIQFDRKLKDIRNEEVRRGWERVKTFQTNTQTLANMAINTRNLIDNSSQIYNWLQDVKTSKGKTGGTKLPKMGSGEKKEDKK